MADKDLYLSDSPNVSKGRVEQDGQLRGVVLQAVPSGDLQLSDSPNVDTGYITDTDGKKHKVNLVAEVEGDLEFPDSENSTTGYVTDGDGKKHRVNLTATLYGGGSDPVISELGVTPSTSAQTITAPEGTDGYSPVNVSAVTASIDANIQAGNIKKDVTILGVTGTYEPSAGGKYQLLQRIKDDSNNDIGCVVGFHKDSNNNEYAVVCLNSNNFINSNNIKNATTETPNLSIYDNFSMAIESDDTATANTDALVADVPAGYNLAPKQARNLSFVIDNITYYGQIPALKELIDIFSHASYINTNDPSGGGGIVFSNTYGSSSAYSTSNMWCIISRSGGSIPVQTQAKSSYIDYCVILELPNA